MHSEQGACVIVGASHAGSQLALQLRRQGWQGDVVLIGAESALPYHRPPLSKAVLSGDKQLDDILLRPAAMYRNNAIDLRCGAQVTQINAAQRQVCLDNGEVLDYARLALCTGARVIRLPLGEGLAGVHYLRNIEDVLRIRAQLAAGKRAVIIGGGYIGLEAASVLSALGLSVTVLERSERLLCRVTGEQMSDFMTRLHGHHGVTIHCNANVISINGKQQVDSVSCEDGSSHTADLVIIGVGIVPETALAEQAGLRVENGICVDEYTRSSDAVIYAAGDCASHPSLRYQRRLRLESVQNANDQARVAAINICGGEQVYDALPWFWSDQYGIKLQSAGLCRGHDRFELLGEARVDMASGFSVLYFRNNRLLAVDCVNQAKVFMRSKALVAAGAKREEALSVLAAD